MTKDILLTQGKVALVDDSDFDDLNQYKWYAHSPGSGNWYAMRNVKLPNGRKTTISMHKYLMGDTSRTDHWDGNGLNNTRKNLRPATNQENCCNCDISSNNTSGFIGVHLFKRTNRWQAYVHFNNNKIHAGYFDTPEEAAIARDEVALKYHGKFARLNFEKVTTADLKKVFEE